MSTSLGASIPMIPQLSLTHPDILTAAGSPSQCVCSSLSPHQQKQLKLGDKMDLWSYLLKPVQRISKYSLLLQDMMRECGSGQAREAAEVKAALEVVHFQLRHGNNLLAMDAIRDCDVRHQLLSTQHILY